MAYNVFYTSVPVLISVLDKDLSEETVMQHPQILFYCQAGRFAIMLLFALLFKCHQVLVLHNFQFSASGQIFVIAEQSKLITTE